MVGLGHGSSLPQARLLWVSAVVGKRNVVAAVAENVGVAVVTGAAGPAAEAVAIVVGVAVPEATVTSLISSVAVAGSRALTRMIAQMVRLPLIGVNGFDVSLGLFCDRSYTPFSQLRIPFSMATLPWRHSGTNLLSQVGSRHLYGRRPVCILLCLARLDD